MNSKFAIIIHGGCGSYDMSNPLEAQNYREKKAALHSIVSAGWQQLAADRSAIDVVESVINQMEDAPCFNAGIGGALDCEKRVSLDASLMLGDTRAVGAVAKLRSVPHAISVARAVLERTDHCFLVDEGLNRFVEEQGFEKIPDENFVTEYQLYWWNKLTKANPNSATMKGTVGCVVLDSQGTIVAGTSTGGMSRNLYGRVGDSGIPGAGTYADNRFGGASATGYGEQILRANLTGYAVHLREFKNLNPMDACKAAIARMAELKDGLGGIIMLSPEGEVGYACNDEALPSAYQTSAMSEPRIIMELNNA